MTSRVQSENADRSGLLHTMLPNADRLKYSRDSHETAPMKTPLTCLDFLLTGYLPGLPACIVERKIVPTTQLEVK